EYCPRRTDTPASAASSRNVAAGRPPRSVMRITASVIWPRRSRWSTRFGTPVMIRMYHEEAAVPPVVAEREGRAPVQGDGRRGLGRLHPPARRARHPDNSGHHTPLPLAG